VIDGDDKSLRRIRSALDGRHVEEIPFMVGGYVLREEFI
jgi:hypothetical protein